MSAGGGGGVPTNWQCVCQILRNSAVCPRILEVEASYKTCIQYISHYHANTI